MCRWLAYSGSPISIEALLYTPVHSLIDQSLHSDLGAETTNGDGFGVGWYDDETDEPGVFRSAEPAWNDMNLHEIARHVRSSTVLAHIRASSGSPVQLTNCHPFRYGNWLFMHNGVIREFTRVKRDLVLEVDPALYPCIQGSTDSEVLFHLALTYGLQDDPVGAMERAVGFVEYVGARQGVDRPIQMTVATTDGTSIWTFRYSSEGDSRTLFFSTKIEALRQLYPDNALFASAGDETRLIVSEPLSPLAGAWNEVPESACAVIQPGDDELRQFTPRAPGTRAHNGRSAVAPA
jgi:predicted glutamine amidotransferase